MYNIYHVCERKNWENEKKTVTVLKMAAVWVSIQLFTVYKNEKVFESAGKTTCIDLVCLNSKVSSKFIKKNLFNGSYTCKTYNIIMYNILYGIYDKLVLILTQIKVFWK